MPIDFDEYPDTRLTYLSRADVIACTEAVDVVATTEAALRLHAQGRTRLPDEAYLGWQTPAGHPARSLAMPGGLSTPDGDTFGVKVINGSLGNPKQGLARSQGLLLLFDPERAWPYVVMEAAYISALRTAAATAVAAAALAPPQSTTLAVLGCGTLAKAHLTLLGRSLPGLERIRVFDVDPGRSAALASRISSDARWDGTKVEVAADPGACARDAAVVVTVTTVTEGYLAYDWLSPGALLSHVSLDDALPEVVERADLVLVDDWALVSQDRRRLLGRLYHAGKLRGPDGQAPPDLDRPAAARRVDGTLGDVLIGGCAGRQKDSDVVLYNPFGMAILDVALGTRIAEVARERGLGREVPV